ncbi:hypothetical protein LEMLEM_LOCUS27869, partial [Lemmus lemmus]
MTVNSSSPPSVPASPSSSLNTYQCHLFSMVPAKLGPISSGNHGVYLLEYRLKPSTALQRVAFVFDAS